MVEKSKKIGVLMGGMSAESEVSLRSGQSVINALKNLGYSYAIINPDRSLADQIKEKNPDIIFNALHGTYGEDGAIPGMLEVIGVPYTHSGVMTSAIAMNKIMTKKVLSNYGVRMAESVEVSVENLLRTNKDPMARPYVIKPIEQGSSVGVIIIKENDPEGIAKKLKDINWNFGDIAMAERYIKGKELSSVVINNKAIGVLELRPKIDFYDYEAKYTDGVTEHIYPAEVSENAYQEAMKFAEVAHNILGARTMSRSDLRYDPDEDKVYFLEINTHPGFTNLSIVPEVANYNGITFEQIVEMLLNDAKCELKP